MKASDPIKKFVLVALLTTIAHAQSVNSGSDGHDGALNPTADLVIDMADHPDGIYHYTSVNIPSGVTVSFVPNAANSPVVWLVQGDCAINGTVYLVGSGRSAGSGGIGGPGGFSGGNGGSSSSPGQGPGGGSVEGGGGSFATGARPYGNYFMIPLIGGSGGGGTTSNNSGGAGGGGALLIAVSGQLEINGTINAKGGYSGSTKGYGSGGGIRIITQRISGNGALAAYSGAGPVGHGRIRFDVMENNFGGTINGVFTQGFQPIIIPAAGQGIQLTIASIAGTAVSPTPSGVLVNPDVIIPAQQTNPVPVVVSCTNIPLNSEISVTVHPANGSDVQAVGINNAGTLAASTATISLNMPRGGGIIYAKCVSGLAGLGADTPLKELRTKSLAETGWTADGERFAKMEITAALGGEQQIAYITETGKRFAMPRN